jgi:SAM-dependent methyltransferase
MRFETFLLDHDVHGKSILDLGCGVGDLWAHLQSREIACEYVGLDLSAEMIAHCRERFTGTDFQHVNVLEWDPNRRFDYVVSFGIHNIRVRHARVMLETVTRRQFELCTKAAHVSLLTDRYAKGFAPYLQPWRAEHVLTLALAITPYVVLRHDYLPNDLSVTLYREPLIDTRAGLVLDC